MGSRATKATTDMIKKYLAEFIAFLLRVNGDKSLPPIFSFPDYLNASGLERLTTKLDFPTGGSHGAVKSCPLAEPGAYPQEIKKGRKSEGWRLFKPSPMNQKMAGIGKIFLRRGKKGQEKIKIRIKIKDSSVDQNPRSSILPGIKIIRISESYEPLG